MGYAQTGCIDPWACNFDGVAVSDDGSCEYLSCTGCTIDWACNYDASASLDDGSCDFSCLMGCTYGDFPGTCQSAANYDPTAQIDDGSCIFDINSPCAGDLDCDGERNTSDLLQVVGNFGATCPANIYFLSRVNIGDGPIGHIVLGTPPSPEGGEDGCTHPGACNCNPDASEDDGSCEFTSCAGCTYALACNYTPSAWIEDASCEFESCLGCTYPWAVDWDPSALIDDQSCDFDLVNPCPTDLNLDGMTGGADVLELLGAYGTPCPE